ncbi:MAG: cell division protein FtsL [Gammaproteobacteria bacterium]|nr:cell division protein FtsL [Gammaproteobacteria bacterium]
MSGRALPWVLGAALFVSALGVIFTIHYSRLLFIELQGLQQTRDELNSEWGRLQLEQGAHARHGRVERLARNELGMEMPAHNEIIMVRPERLTGVSP